MQEEPNPIASGRGDEEKIRTAVNIAVRLGVLFALVAFCLRILAPFVTIVAWAAIIAIAAEGLYERWAGFHGGRRGLAAASLVVLVLLLISLPTIKLSESLLAGARGLSDQIAAGTLSVPPPSEKVSSWPLVGQRVYDGWQLASENLGEAVESAKPQLQAASRRLLSVTQSVGVATIQLLVSIVLAGVMLARRAGGESANKIAMRLFGERGQTLTRLARQTVRSVVQGILGVAAIQALLSGLGFLAVGLPGAGLWALLVLVAAIVQLPVLLVMILPIAIVFSESSTGVAVGFLVWSVAVSVIDNLLKPMLFGRGAQVPTLVIFLGAIGGMLAMGIIGLFVGAVVLAVGYELSVSWLDEKGEAPSIPSGGLAGPDR